MLLLCGTVVCAQDAAKETTKPSASAATREAKPGGPKKRLLVHRRFLRIPVCETSELQDLSITANDGEEVKRMEVRLAGQGQTVSSWVEVDVGRWIGGELKIQLAAKDQNSPRSSFALIHQSNTLAGADENREQKTAKQSAPDEATKKISFAFEVQPILSEKCYACHGPDAHNEDSELRLNDRDSAIESGAIIANDADDSALIERIISDDTDTLMPPPASHLHCLLSDSCSSGRGFVTRFLQTPPRGDALALH